MVLKHKSTLQKGPFFVTEETFSKIFKKNLLPKRKTYGNIYNCQTH